MLGMWQKALSICNENTHISIYNYLLVLFEAQGVYYLVFELTGTQPQNT